MHSDTVQVLVEIPFLSHVKYEINEDHQLVVDRVLSTSMVYPGNYGHIPSTLAGDGDPMDALILNHDAFMPGSLVECRVVAVLYTEDEKGRDEKIMVVPISRVDSRYESVKELEDISDMQRQKISHFSSITSTWKKKNMSMCSVGETDKKRGMLFWIPRYSIDPGRAFLLHIL